MLFLSLAAIGCRYVDVYEKTAELPGHQWSRNTLAIVELDVKDSAWYNVVFVMRHTEKFQFTNILTALEIKDTAKNAKPIIFMRANVPLVNKAGDWAGDNMDDLYYHRVKINQPVLLKTGRYRFILQHEMKQDPLPYILNVGVAIQKTTTP